MNCPICKSKFRDRINRFLDQLTNESDCGFEYRRFEQKFGFDANEVRWHRHVCLARTHGSHLVDRRWHGDSARKDLESLVKSSVPR